MKVCPDCGVLAVKGKYQHLKCCIYWHPRGRPAALKLDQGLFKSAPPVVNPILRAWLSSPTPTSE